MTKSRTASRTRTAPSRSKRPSAVRKQVDVVDRRLERAQRQVLAVVVVLSAVAVWRPLVDPFMVVKLTVLVLGAVMLLGLAGVRAVRSGRLTLPRGPVVVVVAALALVLVLATVTADNVGQAVVGQHRRYAGLLAYLAYLSVFLVALRVYARGAVSGLARAVLVALGLVTAYGLLQVAGGDPYTWQSRLDAPLFSTFGNTNFAAAYVAMTTPVAAAALLFPRTGWASRPVAALLLVLGLGYGVATGATQGVLAAAAGLGVVALAWVLARRRRAGAARAGGGAGRRPAWQLAAAGLTTALVVLVLGLWLAPDVARSGGERVQFWQAALGIFVDHPVLGTGLDSFRDYFTQYRPAEHAVARGFQATDSTHNLPLGMLAQGGLLLGAAYLAFVAVTGWALLRGLWRLAPVDLGPLAGFGGMWAAYQVQSLVSLDVPPLTFLHFLSAAVVLAVAGAASGMLSVPIGLPAARAGRVVPQQGQAGRSGAISALAVLTVLCLAAAWVGSRPLRADVAAGSVKAVKGADALAGLDRAVALAPWEGEYRVRQAQARLDAGDVQGTYEAAAEAAKLRAGSSKLAFGAADLAARVGETDVAAAWLREGLRRDPRNPEALLRAAELTREHDLGQDADQLEQRAEQLREAAG